MPISGYVIVFFVTVVLHAICLWAGMKLTKVDGSFVAMLIIAVVSAAVGLIPNPIGWILSTILMFVLIVKLTDAEFWPDAVLMVLVAKVVAIVVGIFLIGALASSSGQR